MGDVVDITKNLAHATGEAVCQNCSHEWMAVVPAGTVDFQCGECGLFHGVFKGPCVPEGSRYVCNCGCDVFSIVPGGALCRYCGFRHDWDNL